MPSISFGFEINAFIHVIYWDFSSEAFSVPFTSLEVRWYSLLFAIGVIGAYLFGVRTLWLDFLRKSPLLQENQIIQYPILLQKISSSQNPFIEQLAKDVDKESLKKEDKASFINCCALWMQQAPAPHPIAEKYFTTIKSATMAQKRLLLEDSAPGAIVTAKNCVVQYSDKLIWVLFLGMLVGARLAEVCFYDFTYYKENPAEIIKVWKGGLASHGGVAGIVIGFILFWNFSKNKLSFLTWQRMIDIIAIGTAFTAGCIRLGNLFNQEILGRPTDLPWGFIFNNPQDVAHITMPCHPVQLYEAIVYFGIFTALVLIEKKYKGTFPPLCSVGLLFVLVFSARFGIEWLKIPQEVGYVGGLDMGQLLSIPFIIAGVLLLSISYYNKNRYQ